MLLKAKPQRYVLLGMRSSTGLSASAEFVNERFAEVREQCESSCTLGHGSSKNELSRLAMECQRDDWDGYGARAISMQACANASKFLCIIPPEMPQPAIGVEPDGQVSFEWYKDPRHVISVSVSEDSNLHYAAIIGSSSQSGTEPFLGQFPSSILDLIERIVSR